MARIFSHETSQKLRQLADDLCRAVELFQTAGRLDQARHADVLAGNLKDAALRIDRHLAQDIHWANWDTISDREAEVAGLVAQGLTNRQIADSLHIAPRTVETHIERIFEKLHLSRRTQIVAMLHGDAPPARVNRPTRNLRASPAGPNVG